MWSARLESLSFGVVLRTGVVGIQSFHYMGVSSPLFLCAELTGGRRESGLVAGACGRPGDN